MSGARRTRWKIAIVVLILFLVPVSIGIGCADRMLLFPSRHPINAGRALPRMIDVDGRKVEVWTARSPAAFGGREPEAFVLEFCGNATRAEQITQYIADRWKDHPVEVWVMNYPGFGKSEGPATLRAIPPAAIATYDALRARAGDDRPIFLAGNSMGAAPALCVATRRPVAGLILQNPPALRRIILHRHGWWNLWLAAGPIAMQVPRELNAPDTAPHVTAPAVFLLADRDTLVPPSHQQHVVDLYAGPKRVITLKNTGHNDPFPQAAEAELSDAIDWLWEGAK